MPELTEVRWHARAGQGAKTAAQLLALALLRSGKYAQAFPEYGPERRGAPVRAYTRASDSPIRRHDSVTDPDVVVVLDPSLARDATADVSPGTLVLVDGESVPATELAERVGSRFANLVMLGAVAHAIGEPPLAELQDAAAELLGKKADAGALRAAVAEGYAWPS